MAQGLDSLSPMRKSGLSSRLMASASIAIVVVDIWGVNQYIAIEELVSLHNNGNKFFIL